MEKSAPNIWASIYTPPPPNAFVEENNSKLVEVQRALGITPDYIYLVLNGT